MRAEASTAALAAPVLLATSLFGAAAAAPVVLREPAAVDLADVSPIVPDDGRGFVGPDRLARLVEQGGPLPTGGPAGEEGPVWMAARLVSETAEAGWAVVLRQAFFARVDLWLYDEAGALASHTEVGISVGAAAARPGFAVGYELPLHLPPGGRRGRTAGVPRPPTAGLLGSFGLLVATFVTTGSLAPRLAAVRRGVAGAGLALAAYSVALANELLPYASVAVPRPAAFGAWLKATFGLFDSGTMLSQIVTNGLFSLALWGRVRATAREREAALQAERLKTVHVAQLSHDIRSPLHAVQSAVGALAAEAPGGTADLGQFEVVRSSVRSVVARGRGRGA